MAVDGLKSEMEELGLEDHVEEFEGTTEVVCVHIEKMHTLNKNWETEKKKKTFWIK